MPTIAGDLSADIETSPAPLIHVEPQGETPPPYPGEWCRSPEYEEAE